MSHKDEIPGSVKTVVCFVLLVHNQTVVAGQHCLHIYLLDLVIQVLGEVRGAEQNTKLLQRDFQVLSRDLNERLYSLGVGCVRVQAKCLICTRIHLLV